MKCPKCKVQMTKREFDEGICPLLCGWERKVRKPQTRKPQIKIEAKVTVKTYQAKSTVQWSLNQQVSFSKAQERIQAIEAEISEWVALRELAESDEEWTELGFEIASLRRAKELVISNSPEYKDWLRLGQPTWNGQTD